ncbi:cyclic nucleotide-binding domain-containing protein [Devosia sp.]|uniref:cyclic nucleotide-binding domain-containing protein n=1 Tax=Devosia sp. TaxID=1871048 RepID=UPI0035B36210
MRPEDVSGLRELSLFAGMADEGFERLSRAAYLQAFPPHVELFREGDRADFLFVVVEGTVELHASWNGRETSMGMVSRNGTFILAAVIRDACYLMGARTVGRCRLLMIPAEDVRAAFELDDAFARAIVVDLAGCYRGVIKSQKDLKLRTGVERLAAYLLRLAAEQGEEPEVTLPYDKRTLASLLGMTPENLSRAFATLKPYGVAVNGASIAISDREDLGRLAKLSPLIDAPGV